MEYTTGKMGLSTRVKITLIEENIHPLHTANFYDASCVILMTQLALAVFIIYYYQ